VITRLNGKARKMMATDEGKGPQHPDHDKNALILPDFYQCSTGTSIGFVKKCVNGDAE